MCDTSSKECTNGLNNPDSKVHGANMGPTWVLSAPDGPHVGPMNLAIREGIVVSSIVMIIENEYNSIVIPQIFMKRNDDRKW